MKDLAKGLIAPVFLFLLLFLAGWLVIDQAASTATILDPAVTAGPSSDGGGSDPFAIDAVGPNDGQIQLYLANIADGLFQWIIIITAAGALCTILWFLMATLVQRKVVGPAGQSDAFVHWVGALLGYLVICAGAYFAVIEPLNVDEFMDDAIFWGFVGSSAIIGAFVYWLATSIAASPVMKPSVPFAARLWRY
ncbi:hypothetical protein [Erythrobacter aurantius]|uniref:hypothetical protein n=1 Tax=Erythrobacter aurantius TaxID=2909249 RepID=UPI002079AFD0|nr:hypothetical protein [Erythrobacter aurantius]